MKTSGAINFTASHNPPEYNGIKFSTHDGAPALPEVTKQIEAAIAKLGRRADRQRSAACEEDLKTADVKPAFSEAAGRAGGSESDREVRHQGGFRSVLGSGRAATAATFCASTG